MVNGELFPTTANLATIAVALKYLLPFFRCHAEGHIGAINMTSGRWDFACVLFVVRLLMSRKVGYLNEALAVYSIPLKEAMRLEIIQQRFDVNVVVGQRCHLDALWSIFKSPFAIRYRPQPNEENAGERLTLRKLFIREETGLDTTCSCHYATSPPNSST